MGIFCSYFCSLRKTFKDWYMSKIGESRTKCPSPSRDLLVAQADL